MTRRITRPRGFEKYRKKRELGKKGYYVARDPHGRYVKIKHENTGFLPEGWKVFTDDKKGLMYRKDGTLNELTHCLLEIKSRKHARWFSSPKNINIGILFGRITDA